MKDIKKQFPFFIKNSNSIYFDNASTTQKPVQVLEAINSYFSEYCANAGRGSYMIANKVTTAIEDVRKKVKDFINASDEKEIVFTSGATASLNTIAYAWGLHALKTNDEILVCLEDHDSNVLPWIHLKNILAEKKVFIKIIPFKNTSEGNADCKDILKKLNKKTRLIALTHIHNVYGMKTNIEDIRNKLTGDILLSLDAAQSAGHIPINVQQLGVDFLSFSGHKMFASTGTGVLWINKKIHQEIHPFLVGGGVTETQTSGENTLFKELPYLLEGGTQNIPGVISLGYAIDFINQLSIEKIQKHVFSLSQHILEKLRTIDSIEFLPGIQFCKQPAGYGIISFNIKSLISSEISFILNEHNIFVRTGTHCTGRGNRLNDSVRVSLHIYNTEEEVDKFIKILQNIL